MQTDRVAIGASILAIAAAVAPAQRQAGPQPDGGYVVPTAQLLRPAGEQIELAARPVDIAIAPGGGALYVKDNRGVVVIDPETWIVRQELPFTTAGGSMIGLAVDSDGARVLATDSRNTLAIATVGEDGALSWTDPVTLPGPAGRGASYPCGIAVADDGARAYVCLSRNNTLAVVDLDTGAVQMQIDTGIAPYAVVLSPDGSRAYVSCLGGRRPGSEDMTAPSAGTPTLVDERGIAASGTVCFIDLERGAAVAEIETGLSPSGMALTRDGARLYVANYNSDTVTELDTASGEVLRTARVHPDDRLPFGSMPCALALAPDERTLYAANAGNNAVAVISLAGAAIEGFIPTAWGPGGVIATDARLYISSVKGIGSRTPRGGRRGFNSHGHRGTVACVALPDRSTLAEYTRWVRDNGRIPQILASQERATIAAETEPVPVPARPGEPSVFEHVFYIVKENRTYDQVFGDLPQGNADPELCIYGREVTPNHHAIAEQFVLLDNFYCNGVLSADGHSWITEGNVTPYLDRSFGGFSRSYTFGDDPLTYSSSGFIWDHVLGAGLSFRNYGEFDYATEDPDGSYFEVYQDFLDGTGRFSFKQNIGVERLRRFSCPDYPGWNMEIPDVLRAGVFLKELAQFEVTGGLPNLVFIYLPNDHTSGTSPDQPTPRSLVADNDLALGRVIEGISRSRFWPRSCVFVVEDDPQDGFDHVDGHRSLCLVVSPYTKRGAVVSEFYNQTSVYHTIERMLGLTAANQLYALAPVMTTCFTGEPDMTPYTCLPNQTPLAEPHKKLSEMTEAERHWARKSMEQNFEQFDRADEDTLNRVLWHAAKGTDAPYPAHLAGAHGTGLGALRLRLDPEAGEDDD